MMSRVWRLFATTLSLLACITGAVGAAEPNQTAHAEAEVSVVEVPVYLSDSEGGSVTDMRADEFIVKDNGERQKLLFATRVTKGAGGTEEEGSAGGAATGETIALPRNYVFLFDLTFNDPSGLLRAREAAYEFIRTKMSPDDFAGVFTLDTASGVKLLMNFTKDRRQLLNAVATFGSAKGAASLPDSAGLVRLTTNEQNMQQGISTATADLGGGLVVAEGTVGGQVLRDLKRSDILQFRGSIGAYLSGLAGFATGIDILPGRKIILFFSRGFDTKAIAGQTTREASAEAESFTSGNWENLDPTTREVDTRNIDLLDKVVSSLASADCRVFCVDASGAVAGFDAEAPAGEAAARTHAALEMISKETGGALFRATTDVGAVLEKISDSTSSYYLLAYNAPVETRGKYHKIDVDVSRPGVKISHRKGYYGARAFQQYSELDRQIQIGAILAAGRAAGGVEVPSAAVPMPACAKKGQPAAQQQTTARCGIIIELPGAALSKLGAPETKELDVYSFAITSAGEEIHGYLHGVAQIRDAKKAAGLRYTDVIELLPGSYEIRSIIRSARTGEAVTSRTKVAIDAVPGLRLAASFVSEKSAWENTTSKDVAGDCHPFAFKGSIMPVQVQTGSAAGKDVTLMVKAFDLQLDAGGKPDFDLVWSIITPTGMGVSLGSYKFLQGDWPSKSEYDMMFLLTLPPQLPPGAHHLAVRVTDKLRGVSKTVTLPVFTAAGS